MVDCRYCSRDLDLDESNNIAHFVCESEYDARARKEICVRCGEKPMGGENPYIARCDSCGEYSEYKHYPGPQ